MMNEKQYAIEVTDLKKAYQEKQVLKGVTFQVEKGTIFCLLGSNGAGKTTAVKILSTLLSADGGKASINGYDSEHQGREVRRAISLTGQFAAVDEILSGRENLEMIARLCHLSQPKQRAKELLHSFHLEDAAEKRVSTYSGGMRRRLDIAMSLVGHPAVIFLDEPTTGLDPQSRNAMWSIIQDLKDAGVTIFLTTQYLEEAEQLADQVAILHDGVIIANGSVEDIKQLSSKEYIVFSFDEADQLANMKDALGKQVASIDEENLTAMIAIDGGMRQISELFVSMQDKQIMPTSFLQKRATLEDVFLHLVDGQKG